MARIIGEASIRLTASGAASLERSIRQEVRKAASALRGEDFLGPLDRDSEVQSSRIAGRLQSLFSVVTGGAGAFARLIAGASRLALVGTAAGGALAGVTALTTGLISLVGVIGQAAGAAGLLPAAFLAAKAGALTLQLGLVGVGDAMKAIAEGDAAKLEEALQKLSPSARAFTLAVRDLKPAFDQLRLNTQETLFKGLAGTLQPLAERYLPIAQRLTQGVAGAFNEAAREAASFARSGETVGQVSGIADNISAAFDRLPGAIQPALSAFTNIASVGSGFLPQLANGVQRLAIQFGEFINGAAESGQLEAFFERSLQAIEDLFGVFSELGNIIGAVFRASEAASGGFLGGLQETLGTLRAFLDSAEGQSALIDFFKSMQTVVAGLAPVFLELVSVVGSSLAPILADLAATIGPALQPVVAGIGDALEAARPGIQAFASGFASLLRAVAPLLPVLGEVAGAVGSLLGPVLERLGPIIVSVGETIGEALLDLLPQLEPLLLQIVDAFGQVMTALTPLIPVFLQVVQALLPLVPPLLQLVSTLLPPLVSLIQALTPIVVALGEVLAALIPPIAEVAAFILGILIPPLNLIADVIANVARLFAGNVTFISEIATSVFNGIATFIRGIWETIVNIFRGAIQSIGNFVRGGFQAVRDTISGIINGIRNTVGNGINAVIGFFRDLPGKALGFLQDLAGRAFDAGRNIVQGIINGLGNLAGAIFDKIVSIVSAAWDGVLSFFGIASPSRLATWAGEMIGQGLIRGFERIAPDVNESARLLGVEAMAALNGPLAADPNITIGGGGSTAGRATGAATGGATIVNQVNNMLPGTDVGQFATTVLRRGHLDLSASASSMPTQRQGVQFGVNDNFLAGVRM